MKINPVHVAYAVTVIGMMFCFVLSRRQKKDIRKECNAFAAAFTKLSNYICPNRLDPERDRLAVEELEGGALRVLPEKEQPESIRGIMRRANAQRSVKLFAELSAAADRVTKEAGINRTKKYQFSDPINRLLYMTHTFLVGCENPATICTQERKEDFDSFLYNQVDHRMELLRRISREMEREFQDLNRAYAKEMEEREREEKKKKK